MCSHLVWGARDHGHIGRVHGSGTTTESKSYVEMSFMFSLVLRIDETFLSLNICMGSCLTGNYWEIRSPRHSKYRRAQDD